jgi:hypothetical protein
VFLYPHYTEDQKMSEAEKGPSKNELKKLAKKAEKAAKKQAVKAGGGAAPAVGAGGGNNQASASPAPAASVPPAPTPKVLLFNGAEGCTATLKAVWAATHFNFEVGIAKTKDLPAGFSADKKPALIYGNDVVLGGGGNAMCKAIALMGGAEYTFEADEWCEVERTTMRGKDTGSLDKLAAALDESSTGVHLVGDSDSMADICIVAALSKHADKVDDWPAAVQKYYKAHIPALDRVKAAVANYIPAPAVDPNDPRLMQVVTQVFIEAFEAVAPLAELPKTIVNKCANQKHGDFQCSGAMPAFASLKKSGSLPADIKSPPQVAQAVIAHLGNDHRIVCELQIQGPGFISFRISSSYLEEQLQKIVGKSLPLVPTLPRKCMLDTCEVPLSVNLFAVYWSS